MNENKNLPSFPIFTSEGSAGNETGLSKREYASIAAMQGLLASWPVDILPTPADLAQQAVDYSDALLAKLDSE